MSVDPNRMEQVVVNLLNNACKYTEEGGRLALTVALEEDQAVLRVHDSGIGIAPDLLPHIFDLFIQADKSLDRSDGGLGIGLALVQRLTELHGGTVQAFSAGRPGERVRAPSADIAVAGGEPATSPRSKRQPRQPHPCGCSSSRTTWILPKAWPS